jgi:hypothetical protein
MGAIFIVGAFLLPKDKPADAQNGIVVTKAPTRAYIDVDADGNGQADWEEQLAARVIDSIELPEGTTTNVRNDYEKPTTYTGRFAESFFEEYMNSKSGGAELGDVTGLVNEAVASIDASTESKTYTAGDIAIVANSEEAIREYGNRIADIMEKQPSAGENEMAIFSDAMKTNAPEKLEKLQIIKESYKNLVALTLEVETPASYVPIQIELLNRYEALLLDTLAMENSFEDPLFALARIKEHYSDTQNLFVVIKKLQDELLKDGIVYTETDSGAYLYAFKI